LPDLDALLLALVVLQTAELSGDEHRVSTRGTAIALDGVLITNRHLLENQRALYTRLGQSDRPERFRLPLSGDDGQPRWHGHPDPAVDLAAIRAVLPATTTLAGLDRSVLACERLRPGDQVLVCGYHPDVIAGDRPRPVVRSAVVALPPPSAYGGRLGYLIDAIVAPGQSGSAVVVRTGSSWALAGVLEGYLPSRRALLDSRTGRPTHLLEESSGLAVVLTADAIRATLDGLEA